MKHLLKVFLPAFVMVWVCVGLVEKANAQDPDTLDVAQGYETLNVAVEGDTTELGEPKNVNRVYRLAREGYYYLNGAIVNIAGHIVDGYPDSIAAVPLRIVAAEGTGPRPMIIPATDEEGAADRAFRPSGDGSWKDLYVTGIHDLGFQASKNMFRCGKRGGRFVIDGCFLDHDAQSFVRMDAPDQKLFITNTIMRNSIKTADPGNGRFIDTRGNNQDTIFVQNCTFYVCSDKILRDDHCIINYIFWDHVTTYQAGDQLEIEKAISAKITNSLFIDVSFEGTILSPGDPADTTLPMMIELDSLDAPAIATEEERNIVIINNNFVLSPSIQTWFDGIDTLYAPVVFDQDGQFMIDTYPKMVAYNNIAEDPEFADAPDPAVVLAYAQHRLATDFSNEGNPEIRADRNGMSAELSSVGPAADEYDFDYPTTKLSYTGGRGGFPMGALNWFPTKKAEWEAVVVAIDPDANTAVPDRFALDQNYPNPFNPSTTIAYRLNEAADIKLTVYNMLGQNIRTLVNKKSQAGEYSVQWDGRNDAGNLVASGIYFYQLVAGDQIQVRKMLLMR